MNFFNEGRDHAKKIAEKDGIKKARDKLAFNIKWNREFNYYSSEKTTHEFWYGYKSFIKENRKS